MKPFFKSLSSLALAAFSLTGHSQSIPEKTLLWRIEGKNITTPSYIYGTMHLFDQRLFNFGDSVYHALESSKGFANEIDPAVFIDSMFAEIKADNSARLEEMVDKKKYKEIAKKLKEKLDIDADELTSKKIAGKRTSWYYNQRSKDDMDAVVDFFLYDVAKRQGKVTGGIEEYADQKDLFDEMGSAIDIEKFANENPATWKMNLNKFIDIYLAQDIENIYRLSSDRKSDFNSKKILDDRNIKMAHNIDSLIHIRSTFFAVGAAHLAGELGLINILRTKGYKMVPVFSSQKLHAKKYSFKSIEIPWETISSDDKSYTVEMPGKASNLNFSEDAPPFKMYADFGNTLFYMTTAMPALLVDNDPKVTLDKAVERFTEGSKQKTSSSKFISYQGSPAVEVSSSKDGIFYKMTLVLKDKRVYLLIVGAQKKEVLDVPETSRFLQSLKINNDFIAAPSSWHHFKDSKLAIEVDFPGKPSIKNEKQDEETDKVWKVATYSSSDLKTGSYYSMILLETAPGYLITDDTAILNSKIEIFESRDDFKILNKAYYSWDGYPALKYKAKLKQDGFEFLLDVITVNRINRNFTAMAVVPDNEQGATDAATFTKSFKLVDFEAGAWENRNLPENIGHTWGPAIFTTDKTDSSDDSGKDKSRVHFMIDQSNSVNYSIEISGFNRYFSRPDEDSLLREIAATFYSDSTKKSVLYYNAPSDSLIYVKKVSNGNNSGMEVLVRQPSVHHYKKIRIFINGDSTYQLIAFAPLKELQDKNSMRFFDDFRFNKPDQKSQLYDNHSKAMTEGLSSADSATRAEAKDALEDAVFTKTDLPLLHEALLKNYPADTFGFYRINNILVEKIAKVKEPSSIDFVAQAYKTAALAKDEKAMNLLEVLTEMQTSASFSMLKKLWLEFPPQAKSSYPLSALDDSLELTASLFPEMMKLYADTISGDILIDAAASLMDSNKIAKEHIAGNENGIYEQALWQLNHFKKGEYYNYNTYALIRLLIAMNTKESETLLADFTRQPDIDISLYTTIQLIEKDKLVDNAVLDKIAASPENRMELFETLKKTGKEKLFPKKFNNQLSIAEGQMAVLASEEDIYFKEIKPLFTHKETGKNSAGIYYSFKITDDEGGAYLGFVGPYPKGSMDRPYTELKYQVLYDVSFNKSVVNDFFKKFLSEAADE